MIYKDWSSNIRQKSNAIVYISSGGHFPYIGRVAVVFNCWCINSRRIKRLILINFKRNYERETSIFPLYNCCCWWLLSFLDSYLTNSHLRTIFSFKFQPTIYQTKLWEYLYKQKSIWLTTKILTKYCILSITNKSSFFLSKLFREFISINQLERTRKYSFKK